MSEAIELSAKMRNDTGKGASRRLRRAEMVPAVVYGGDEKPISIVIEARIIRRLLEEETFYSQVISLEIDGKKQNVILKDLQRHPAKEFALHLDFLRISASHEVTTTIPLHFINEDICVGVKAGGKIAHSTTETKVRCLPAKLPEFIEVDVADLQVGSTIHLTDLNLPEGVQLVQLLQGESHDTGIVSVNMPKKVVESETVETQEVPQIDNKKEENK